MIAARTDTSRFRARIAALRKRLPAARRDAVTENARRFIVAIQRYAPRDTNRYVRAWIEAGWAVGLTNTPIPVVVPSRYLQKYVAGFEAAIAGLGSRLHAERSRMEAWYEKKGRREDKTYRRMKQRVESLSAKIIRLREQLAELLKHNDAIVFDVYASSKTGGNFESAIRGGNKRLPSIRQKIYGGQGRRIEGANRTTFILKNLEPHCRIIEKRSRPVAKAKAAAKIEGVRTPFAKLIGKV